MMKLNIQLFANYYVNPSYGKNEWGGTYSEHTAKRYKWRIYTKIKEQDTVNNKTTLAVGFYQTGTWGSYYGMNSTYSEIDYRIKGDDGTWSDWKQLVREKTPNFTEKDDVDTWDKKVGKDLTISHKADGTSRYFQIRGLNDSGNTTTYAPYSITVTSDYLYVPTIPRESKFVSDPIISNNKIQFDYTKYTTSFTDSVTISCYGTNLFEPFKPTDAVGTVTIQKDLTQSNIDTIVQKANTNNVTSVPIVITSITKDGNGNPIGTTQSKTIYYNLIASTINSITFSISNSAISLLPSFTPISSSNLKHKIKLTYLVGNIQYDTTPVVITNHTAFSLDSNDVNRLFSRLATKTSSALVTFTLYTYLNSNDTFVGTTTKDVSYSLPVYTITGNISAAEGNTISGITKASTTFIRYLSKMNLTFSAKKASDNATSFYGRTIKYKIGTVNVTSPYSHNYDGTVPTVIAYTDLGDNLSLDVTGCNYVAYQYPICNINAYRSDAQGHAMQTGNCVKFEITITYFKEQTQSHLITEYSRETPVFTLRYKEDGDPTTSQTLFTQSGIDPTTTISNNVVTATYTKIISGMNYEKQLNYTLSGSDCVNQDIDIELGIVLPGRPGIYGYKKAGDNYTGINDHLILSNRTGKNILEVSSSNNSKYINTLPAKNGTFAMTDDITSYHDSTKQDKLVSGTNIATVNNHDLLSGGNIEISGGSATNVKINGTSITSDGIADIKTNSTYNASSNKIATMNDLPTVNNATLTIQKNGVDVQTFTANSSTNKTANITVPTKTSDLTNDDNVVKDASYVHTDNNYTTTEKNKLSGIASGAEVNVQSDWSQSDSASDAFIKNKPTIPTKTSQLTNDSNYISSSQSTVGSSDKPIYLNNGTPTQTNTPTSGNYFRGVPFVTSGGVIEIGRYIDFHPTNDSTLDFSKRIDAGTGTTARTLTLPDKSGTLAITGDIPTNTNQLTNGAGFITSSGSITGNAATATNLKEHTINRNNNSYIWAKVATTTMSSTYGEKHAYLFIKGSHNSNYNQNGIVALDAVGNNTAGAVGSYGAKFMSCTLDLDVSNFYIEYVNGDSSTPATINFWARINTNGWASWRVMILQNSGWTISSATTSVSTLPSTGYTGKNAERVGYAARSYGDKNGDDITTTYYKASNPNGYTSNTGTITGITMNGASKGTSGVVDLGTVLTSHQSLANYVTLNGAQTITGVKTFNANTNFNKKEAQNFALQKLSSAPSSPVNGQMYYNTNTGSVYAYANGGWVDVLATTEPTENYNQLFNRPITNLEGTDTEPLILANLSHGTYRVMGEYKYDSSDTLKSTDGALILVFGQDSETKRIIFGEGGVIIGNGTIENGKFKSLLPIVTTSSMTANSTIINGWKTELIDGVLVEYYGG